MSQFVGKWKVESEENLDELFKACGVDEEMRAKAREGLIQPIQEISTVEDGYVIKTTVGHLSTEVRFKLGISFPSSSMDGKKIMVTYRMIEDTLEEVQQYSDYEALISREVKGNELVSTITGKGKKAIIRTTVGKKLAEKLKIPFRDADEFHSKENKKKMSEGIPLTDQDRFPWLLAIHNYMKGLSNEGKSGVVTCSALKKLYRDILVNGQAPVPQKEPPQVVPMIKDLVFVLLHGDREILEERMNQRVGHFMPSSLLTSQLATLEVPTEEEKCVQVDVKNSPDSLVDQIIDKIKTLY